MAKAYAKAVVTYTTYYEMDLDDADCEGTYIQAAENHEMTDRLVKEEDGSYSVNDFNLCVEIDKLDLCNGEITVHDLGRVKPQVTADVTLVDEAEFTKNSN